MSDTLLHDAAIEVLKNHAQAIKTTDYILTVRTSAQETNDAAAQEVASALRVLSSEIAVTVELNQDGCYTAKAISALPADNSLPVKQLATMIADAGVNFPGSVNYRTPGLNPV